ncbi:MAG: hypothetical protein JXR97_10105 [Planctomycetes bacterium]|nr:hypothetical protein [Planctomycetota bacterium]
MRLDKSLIKAALSEANQVPFACLADLPLTLQARRSDKYLKGKGAMMSEEAQKKINDTPEEIQLQKVSIGDWSAIGGLSLILIAYVIFGFGVENIPVFIDLPFMPVVGGIVLGGLLAGHGMRQPYNALWCAVKGYVRSEREATIAEDIFSTGIRLSILAGSAGALIGLVRMLISGTDSPDELANGLALSILSLFYSIVLALGFCIFRSRIIRALVRMREAERSGTLAQPIVCHHSMWLLALIPVVILIIAVIIQHVMLAEFDEPYRLTINNDTSAEWMYSGYVITSALEDAKKTSSEKLWPKRIWSFDSDSEKINRMLERSNGEQRLPSKVFLVFADTNGSHMMTVEENWPKDSRKLELKVSDYVDSNTISLITSNRPFPPVQVGSGSMIVNRENAFDPKELRKIVLADNPTVEQVRDYIDNVLGVTKSHNGFNEEDSIEVYMLMKVGKNNIPLLIDALPFYEGVSSWRLCQAIDNLADDSNKSLIIGNLQNNKDLIKVILSRSWEIDAKDILVKEMSKRKDFIRTEWIQAVANLEDPSAYNDLKWYLVNGLNPHMTFESVKNLPGFELEPALQSLWDRLKTEGGWELVPVAKILAPRGNKDALEQLVTPLTSTEQDSYAKPEIRRIICDLTGVKGDYAYIVKWYEENKKLLVFDEVTKKYTLSKSR